MYSVFYMHLPLSSDIVSGLSRLLDLILAGVRDLIYFYIPLIHVISRRLSSPSSLSLHTIHLQLDTPHQRQRWIDLAKGILAECPQDDVAKNIITKL